MRIEFDGLSLLTDPTLGDSFVMGDPNDPVDFRTERIHHRATPRPRIDLDDVDLVVLSHIHEDHLDQAALARLDRRRPVVAPVADVPALRRKGFADVRGLDWGDSETQAGAPGEVRLTAVVARHSRDPATSKLLGRGNGYWFEFSRGDWRRTLYWTGDTMPTPDVVLAVRALGRPDILVPHVGGVGPGGPFGPISMAAGDVVELADALRPRYLLPIHHSTYAFYRQPIDALAAAARGKPYRLDLVAAGATVAYD